MFAVYQRSCDGFRALGAIFWAGLAAVCDYFCSLCSVFGAFGSFQGLGPSVALWRLWEMYIGSLWVVPEFHPYSFVPPPHRSSGSRHRLRNFVNSRSLTRLNQCFDFVVLAFAIVSLLPRCSDNATELSTIGSSFALSLQHPQPFAVEPTSVLPEPARPRNQNCHGGQCAPPHKPSSHEPPSPSLQYRHAAISLAIILKDILALFGLTPAAYRPGAEPYASYDKGDSHHAAVEDILRAVFLDRWDLAMTESDRTWTSAFGSHTPLHIPSLTSRLGTLRERWAAAARELYTSGIMLRARRTDSLMLSRLPRELRDMVYKYVAQPAWRQGLVAVAETQPGGFGFTHPLVPVAPFPIRFGNAILYVPNGDRQVLWDFALHGTVCTPSVSALPPRFHFLA
jgi:hypothetical protein